jgi:hypothetical protein
MVSSAVKRVLFSGKFIIATIVVGMIGLFIFGDWPLNGIHVEELKADLNAQLPDGSTREQAEAWFASHNFKFEDISDKNGWVGLSAHVPNDSFLVSAWIDIDLYFSKDGRLTKRFIERYADSL